MRISEVMGGEAPWLQTLRQLLKKGETVMFAPRVSKLFKVEDIENEQGRYVLKLTTTLDVDGKQVIKHSLGFINHGERYELKVIPEGRYENAWLLRRAA